MKIKEFVLFAALLLSFTSCSSNNQTNKKEIYGEGEVVDKYDYLLDTGDEAYINISTLSYTKERYDFTSFVGKFSLDEGDQIDNLHFEWVGKGNERVKIKCLGAFEDVHITRLNFSNDNYHFSFPTDIYLKYQSCEDNYPFPTSIYNVGFTDVNYNIGYIYLPKYDYKYLNNSEIIINNIVCDFENVEINEVGYTYAINHSNIFFHLEYSPLEFPFKVNCEGQDFIIYIRYTKNQNFNKQGCYLYVDLTINGDRQNSFVRF